MDAHWQSCLDLFLQSILDHSGSTTSTKTYRLTLLRFFARDPERSPGDFTRTDVLLFLRAPSTCRYNYGQPVSASTKNQRLSVLRSFYRFASEYEIDGVPLFDKPLPTRGLKSLKTDITNRAMTADELTRFFAAIPKDTPKGIRDHAIFLTYFYTARRRMEIARLKWRDIEAATIIEPDETRRPGYIYRYYAKGHARQIKTAELPAPAWNAIDAYLHASGRYATIQPNDALFTAIRPGQGRKDHEKNLPLHFDYICSEFKRYCKLAGLDRRYSIHSLRHTSAQQRRQAGQDILEIKELLGHERLETTWRYLVTQTGAVDTGARLLERRFGEL